MQGYFFSKPLPVPDFEKWALGRVAIEAAVRQPWDWLLMGERGDWKRQDFVGMTGFGASAPAERLYKEFGITPEDTVAKVKALL